jgi:glutathione S-transferase
MTALVAIVTVLVLLFYFWTSMGVGRMRGRHKIDAPAMTGHPDLERAIRVHTNTLEWLVIFLPGMWLCAAYVNPILAAVTGIVWIGGRYVYMTGYMKDPKSRHTGFMIQALATAVALFAGLIGAVVSLFTGGGGT